MNKYYLFFFFVIFLVFCVNCSNNKKEHFTLSTKSILSKDLTFPNRFATTSEFISNITYLTHDGKTDPIPITKVAGGYELTVIPDQKIWHQMCFPKKVTLNMVHLLSSSTSDNWVKSFKLEYQNNRGQWIEHPTIFAGNTKRNVLSSKYILPSITAKCIRFVPLEWNGKPIYRINFSLSFEMDLVAPCRNYKYKTLLSVHNSNYGRIKYRIPERNYNFPVPPPNGDRDIVIRPNESIQMCYSSPINVKVIKLRALSNGYGVITKFKLQYSEDAKTYKDYMNGKIFDGNSKYNAPIYRELNFENKIRCIKFIPVEFEKAPGFRLDFLYEDGNTINISNEQDIIVSHPQYPKISEIPVNQLRKSNLYPKITDMTVEQIKQHPKYPTSDFYSVNEYRKHYLFRSIDDNQNLEVPMYDIDDVKYKSKVPYDDNFNPYKQRLNGKMVYQSKNNKDDYLEVDFPIKYTISRVATQGRENYSQFLRSYKLSYSTNGHSDFVEYKENDKVKIFNANNDSTQIVDNRIAKPFVAKSVRIHPIDFSGQFPTFRFALYVKLFSFPEQTIADLRMDQLKMSPEYKDINSYSMEQIMQHPLYPKCKKISDYDVEDLKKLKKYKEYNLVQNFSRDEIKKNENCKILFDYDLDDLKQHEDFPTKPIFEDITEEQFKQHKYYPKCTYFNQFTKDDLKQHPSFQICKKLENYTKDELRKQMGCKDLKDLPIEDHPEYKTLEEYTVEDMEKEGLLPKCKDLFHYTADELKAHPAFPNCKSIDGYSLEELKYNPNFPKCKDLNDYTVDEIKQHYKYLGCALF